MSTQPQITKPFKVLFADGYPQRARMYRLMRKPTDPPAAMRISVTALDFEKALKDSTWDLVITAGSLLGTYNSSETMRQMLVTSLIEGFFQDRIKGGVIVTATEANYGPEIVKELRRSNVPALWIPYNYSQPSLHSIRVVI